MKKYFMSYESRRIIRNCLTTDWLAGQCIIEEHPLTWLYDTKQYKDEEYRVIFWKELSEEDQKFIREDKDLPLT